MHCKKKYDEGGLYEVSRRASRKIRKAERKAEKRNRKRKEEIDRGTPSNPRFLVGAPTRVNGQPVQRQDKEEKKRRVKVVKRNGRPCLTTGGTQQGRGRRTAASCRN
tara:strand:- start:15903 stop:16223 length:321 start_codon:yes stop_codon:yes gene_type:complete